jgi:hypothetical protein
MKGKKNSKEQGKPLDESKEFIDKISSKIRKLRIAKGYKSHETFAYEHGIDRTQWGKIERGINMKMTSLFSALKALEISPAEFFKDFK